MQRRAVLKLVAGAAGILSLPVWAEGWTKDSVHPAPGLFTPAQDELLAEIVETIIPQTDTPGAKELDVHRFIQKMVADCYEKEVQENLVKGLKSMEAGAGQAYQQSFARCSTDQRISLLSQMAEAEDTALKECFALIKELTIQGYMTSEYVMTNLTNYQMVPGHYHGCVPVEGK